MAAALRRYGFLRGWRLFLATVAALVFVTWWNDRAARSGALHGPRPANATWVVSTTDFPASWSRLQRSDEFRRVQELWPRPWASFELALRKAAGIRPTPMRWQIWLGYRLAVAGSPDGVGVSTYPGVLLRWAELAYRLVPGSHDQNGIARWGNLYYGWRDGFLVASRSQAYVIRCVTDPAPSTLKSRDDGTPVLEWTGLHEGSLRLLPGPGLPVEGRVHVALTHSGHPLTLSGAWHGKPMLSLTVRRARDFAALLDALNSPLERYPAWDPMWQWAANTWHTWRLPPLPSAWDENIGHMSFAVLGLTQHATPPLPRLALVMRGTPPSVVENPLLPLTQGQSTIPYEWEGQPGLCLPLLGSPFSLYLGQAGQDWVAATFEPDLGDLARGLGEGSAEAPDIDAVLRMSWANCMDAQWVIDAARLELLPGMNGDDAQSTLEPIVKGLNQLGELVIKGRSDGEWVEFTGTLSHMQLDEGATGP